MNSIIRHRLTLRLITLAVLIACLVVISRQNSNAGLATSRPLRPSLDQGQDPTPAPIMTARAQVDSPLVISAPRILSEDRQYVEIAYDLINVSKKPIRAYAIKEEVEATETRSGKVSFSNLDLTNSPPLKTNQLVTRFDTLDLTPSKQDHLSFSIDYVEFSDGTAWGPDSARSAERSAGQRAAALVLSTQLLKVLNTRPGDVMSTLENDASIEPPAGRSQEWKEGFRLGCSSIASHLKRAQARGQVDRELRLFNEVFSDRRK